MEAGSRNRRVLGSWKEIAAYLGKGVRTVQRWENLLGLPVRRPNGAAKGVVYVLPDELDRWLTKQWQKRSITRFSVPGQPDDFNHAIKASQELRRANEKLIAELQQNLRALREHCEALAQAAEQARITKNTLKRGEGRVERSWRGRG